MSNNIGCGCPACIPRRDRTRPHAFRKPPQLKIVRAWGRKPGVLAIEMELVAELST